VSRLLDAMARSDRDALAGMLGEDVVFHSPATTYQGREQVVDLLAVGGRVIEGPTPTREPQTLDEGETLTFLRGSIDGEQLDGVLIEIADEEGRIAELTIFLRPLAALQTAIRHIARALAEPGG
jgi:SnoaL-like protein